jgi:hypothetical protein
VLQPQPLMRPEGRHSNLLRTEAVGPDKLPSRRSLLSRLLVCCVLAWGGVSAAQTQSASAPAATPALPVTNASVQPIGVKLGDGRLHPFLDVEGRYDSVVGFFNDSGRSPSPEFIVHPRAGLQFLLDTPSTAVSFNGMAEYLLYTGLLSPTSTGLSRLQANVGVDLQFNRDGAVEFQIGDTLTRSDRTQNVAAGVGIVSLYNDLRVALPIHPGGGALEIAPRASWQVEFFDPLQVGTISGCPSGADITCNASLVSQMSYSNLRFGVGNSWRFLPKTAFVLDGDVDYRTYLNNQIDNRIATVLRVQGGLVGLISPRFRVTLLAGFGGDFAGSGARTIIGQAEAAYLPNDQTRVALGYLRTVLPVPVYGTNGVDRGYFNARLGFWGGRLGLNAQLSLDYLTFYSNAQRNDLLVQLSLGPEFAVTSWFVLGAGYALGTRASFGAQYTQLAPVNYVRHEGNVRLTFRY